MSEDGATSDLLGGAGWLGDMPDDVLAELAGEATVEQLPAGSTLYREGDPPTDLSVVVRGRLRASRDGQQGVGVDREIGRGEPVGEVGVMTGEPRAATVVAIRDSEVVRVPAEAVERALAAAPSAAKALARVLVERLADPIRLPTQTAVATLVPLSDRADVSGLAADLRAALERQGARVATPGHDGVTDPVDAAELSALVDRLEGDGTVVVLPADGRSDWWDEACGRHADKLLLAGAGTRPTIDSNARDLLDALDAAGASPARELLLSHPAHSSQATGAVGWLNRTAPDRHHNLREGNADHADRVARHLLGRTVGLVLSGGGARAMAHLGAYRALREAGIPIDHTGGSSIGGVVAAQIATEADPAELVELNRRAFKAADFGRRITLPVISLLSIRTAIPLFDELFGDLDLAETWTPTFVTTVDFTDCAMVLRDRGPAALWTRATASPPGLWPPVVGPDGHLSVDGSVLDNLPVEAMRRRGAARTVAVNVSPKKGLSVEPNVAEVNSWTGWVGRLVKERDASYPTIVAMLMRMGLVSSLPAQAEALAAADLAIEPPVDQYGLASYGPFDDIVESGYRAASDALDQDAGALSV